MIFKRQQLPNGDPRPEGMESAIDQMDKWYMRESAWVSGYVQLLEKQLCDLMQRCQQCQYRNQEGSACHDQEPGGRY